MLVTDLGNCLGDWGGALLRIFKELKCPKSSMGKRLPSNQGCRIDLKNHASFAGILGQGAVRCEDQIIHGVLCTGNRLCLLTCLEPCIFISLNIHTVKQAQIRLYPRGATAVDSLALALTGEAGTIAGWCLTVRHRSEMRIYCSLILSARSLFSTSFSTSFCLYML